MNTTIEMAKEKLTEAEAAVETGRLAVQALTRRVQVSNAALSKAVSGWTSAWPPMSREELVRSTLRAELDAKIAGEFPPSAVITPGNSYVDRLAAAGTGGDANDFARKQTRNGGYRRGTIHEGQFIPGGVLKRGQVVLPRPKLPSER
jgi:hypothetical protein